MRLIPLGYHVCVRHEDWVYETPSGIVIPSVNRDTNPMRGEVVATGPGAHLDDGRFVPIEVRPGDKVIFDRDEYPSYKDDDGKSVYILGYDDILAVIE